MQDEQFIAWHGYRCVLPDVHVFVERQPETWMAVGYELATKMTIMEQPVHNSLAGRQHCQVWVNSFRSENSKLGLLSQMLEWEIY
jgi:hypothetical protein